MAITITTLSPRWEPAYRAFLAANDQALIHASVEYGNFLGQVVDGERVTFLAIDGERIVGALPLMICTRSEIGTVVNSLPWYGSHGGCVIAAGAPTDTRSSLLAAYQSFIARDDLLSATLVLSPFEQSQLSSYTERLQPYLTDQRIGQITPLPKRPAEDSFPLTPSPSSASGEGSKQYSQQIENDLLMTYRQKTRNVVRKSLRQGFNLRQDDGDEAWEFLYATHRENMLALGGKAKPWEHFTALRATIPAKMRQLYVASDGSTDAAAMLLLYFNRTVEYFTPVIRHEFRERQPLTFLIHRAMHEAVESGYRLWNWGGTWVGQTSLHHFKQGWGADDWHYTYLIHTTDDGVARLRGLRERLGQLFPWYYVFPYDRLAQQAA